MVGVGAGGAAVEAAFRFTSPGANKRVKTSLMAAVRVIPLPPEVLGAPLEGAVEAVVAVAVVWAEGLKVEGWGTFVGAGPLLVAAKATVGATKVAGAAAADAAATAAGATSAAA